MRLSKRDIGKLLLVEFHDHATGRKAIASRAVGWLVGYDHRSLCLRHWDTPDDCDVDNSDAEDAIDRKAIDEIHRLA